MRRFPVIAIPLLLIGLLRIQQPLQAQYMSVSEWVDSLSRVQNARDSVDVLNQIAWGLQSNLDSGLSYALQAFEISEQRGYEKGLGDSYARLGIMAEKMENFELAVFFYQNSLEIRKIQDPMSNSTAGAYNNLGNALAGRSYYPEAIQQYREAIRIRVNLVEKGELNPYNLARVFINLSSALAIEGYHQAAIDTLREIDCLDLGENLSYLVTKLEQSLGFAFAKANQPDSALAHYQLSLKSALLLDASLEERAEILNQMGLVAQADGQHQTAIDAYFGSALALIADQSSSRLKGNLLQNIASSYASLGQTKKALGSFQKGKQVLEEFRQVNRTQSLANIDLLYAAEKFRRKTQILYADNRIERQNKWLAIMLALLILVLAVSGFVWQTNRSQKQKKQLEETMKQIRSETTQMILASRKEQLERIAQELHHNLGNMLASIRLSLSGMETYVRNWQKEYADTFLTATSQLDDACQAVRDISREMYAGKLAKFGLEAALHEMTNPIIRSGRMQVHLEVLLPETPLPGPIEEHTYHLCQELVSNALHHSNAQNLSIEVLEEEEEAQLSITIEDDGIGFDPEQLPKNNGIGLSSLNTQTLALGGTFIIDAKPGRGATFLINLPLSIDIPTPKS